MAVKRSARKSPKIKKKSKSKASLLRGGRGPSLKAKHSKVAKLIKLAKARARNKTVGKKRRK